MLPFSVYIATLRRRTGFLGSRSRVSFSIVMPSFLVRIAMPMRRRTGFSSSWSAMSQHRAVTDFGLHLDVDCPFIRVR